MLHDLGNRTDREKLHSVNVGRRRGETGLEGRDPEEQPDTVPSL